ncbi:Calcium/calmodulin-dependent/calcium-dependent protein kinase [Penicillium paradoxum]|uniref:Calcium/calmodulin-dependent/calcium-dependent protein kinase n=1 Tax=Penicillium paradoxum TaxID=176176 RepID=UPI0025498EC3|nr:Calcium/calmodulin-dependent/calcium-dependent protein kinase [Penicillium paradoxum]KAJ5779720.1 Calcium/calmodulin-dependent/calcium-dependent protein kinase [Penicillium paradoxum]
MQHSQLAPLPNDVPFRIVSKTIGQGAYAWYEEDQSHCGATINFIRFFSIKKACPLDSDNPVFAVKYIHKDYAARHGKISARQLQMEVTVHRHVSGHVNIINFYQTGEDEVWRWIAMELAEGGDLFDKIEADEGVGEDIAHVYFSQLVSAVGFMHSKGVGHRDIKPENMLLTGEGNLKIADFGLAALFEYKGTRKLSTTFCGSPPYIAPEVITNSSKGQNKGAGYHPDLVDIWSCGIVLFVLLAGNTPWDSPTDDSYEYHEYVTTKARTTDELWQKLPPATLSLLRGMLTIDPKSRFSLEDVRRHPWYTRTNKYISHDGKLRDPINLATSMFESLHIDFSQDPLSHLRKGTSRGLDPMDVDVDATGAAFSSTQPEMLGGGMLMDWDRPQDAEVFSATQPLKKKFASQDAAMVGHLEDEPSMSQFSQQPSVPVSRTQNAQKFHDIIPSRSLTRFYSAWELKLLVPLICEALHRLGVPVPSVPAVSAGDSSANVRVVAKDGRMCPLQGKILIECVSEGLFEVEFVKIKGDPLEWRRFFKKVAILCKDAVFRPDE